MSTANVARLLPLAGVLVVMAACLWEAVAVMHHNDSYADAQLGQPVRVGQRQLDVRRVTFASGLTGFRPEPPAPAAGKVWAIVDLGVSNLADADLEDPSHGMSVSVVDTTGTHYRQSRQVLVGGPAGFAQLGGMRVVEPGAVRVGSVAFQVPRGATLDHVDIAGFLPDRRSLTVNLHDAHAETHDRGVVRRGHEARVGELGLVVHGARPRRGYNTGDQRRRREQRGQARQRARMMAQLRSQHYPPALARQVLAARFHPAAQHTPVHIRKAVIPPVHGWRVLDVAISIHNRAHRVYDPSATLGTALPAAAPDAPGASTIFLVDSAGHHYPPLDAVKIHPGEILPEPIWWDEQPLRPMERVRAWVPFRVRAGQRLWLEWREHALAPPVRFALT